MRIKCDYCESYISDTDERCPNCGAANNHLRRVGNEVPQTIEELKNWYTEHNLPPEEVTRFFIGKNIQEPRAFGIYCDEGSKNFIVYKNKDTGERAIRYEGKDEAYAVNELYMKLKEEIFNQKQNNLNNPVTYSNHKVKSNRLYWAYLIFFFGFPLVVTLYTIFNILKPGYYYHNGKPYYLYKICVKSVENCELYKYDIDRNSWSLSNDASKLRKKENVGFEWNNTGNIEIKKNYDQEDCYLQLHPPEISDGYYTYDNVIYYYRGGNWYRYVNGSWVLASLPNNSVRLRPDNYYNEDNTSNDIYNFREYYSENYGSSSNDSSNSSSDDRWSSSSSNDSWDSSSSWDSSDSWDSGSTDWGSDW